MASDRPEQQLAQALHNANNQLLVIGGSVDLAILKLDPVRDEVVLAHLKRAKLAVARHAKLNADALTIATALLLQEPQTHEVELGALINEIAAACAVMLPWVSIVTQPPALALYTRLDRDTLEDALLNLAKNAGDAMPGGGTLTLSTILEDDGRQVCVRVQDTGTGIDDSTLTRIFNLGFSTKGARGGKGLGLSQVKAFCESHGGEVRVETVLGQGTIFYLCFPRLLSPGPSRSSSHARAAVEAVEAAAYDTAEKANRAVDAVTRSEA